MMIRSNIFATTLFALLVFMISAASALALADEAPPALGTLNDLVAELKREGANTNVGFLSAANFHSVHTILPDTVVPQYYEHSADLVDDVLSGVITAALVSGLPEKNVDQLHVFSSTLISPRAMLMRLHGRNDPEDSAPEDLEDAIDAAIVRVLDRGMDVKIAERQPKPFEFVAVHTCKSNSEAMFPFPSEANATGLLKEVLDTNTLKVAALGPYNWGTSGDYTANPPTGFYPEFLTEVMGELSAAYNRTIQAERVWNRNSTSVMNSVLDGRAHVTEPYWTVDAFHNGRARKNAFLISCTTLGVDSTFFTKRTSYEVSRVSQPGKDSLSDAAVWGIVVLAVVAISAVVTIAVLVSREKKGKPVFAPLLVPEGTSAGAV